MRILYKIVPAGEWRNAEAKGVFEGSAVDLRDGFIHLSAAHQVRETAARHFAGQQDLLLIGFREADLPALTWEASRGGDLFPHLYGELDFDAVLSVTDLPLRADGSHAIPELAP